MSRDHDRTDRAGWFDPAPRRSQETGERSGGSAAGALRQKTLFGRRKGHTLSPTQQARYDQLLPPLRLDLDAAPDHELVRHAARAGLPVDAPIWLEVGFGGGEHLAHRAGQNPNVLFLGCEPFVNGVAKLVSALDDAGLTNVAVHDDDVREVLAWLPAASLERIFILYPDPWPKKRHNKRRLLQRPFLEELARAAAPRAHLLVATDITDYVRSFLEEVALCPAWRWTARTPAQWRTPPDGWPGTRYEAKAKAAGRRCHYLHFVRRG